MFLKKNNEFDCFLKKTLNLYIVFSALLFADTFLKRNIKFYGSSCVGV